MENNIKLANLLTYSGTLPFLFGAVTMVFGLRIIDDNFLITTYGAIIISFLCGIHWAIYLFFQEKCKHNLFIASNAITLLAWCSLFLPSALFTLLIESFCFLCLFYLDATLNHAGILPQWFYKLRRNATFIVVACLLTVSAIVFY